MWGVVQSVTKLAIAIFDLAKAIRDLTAAIIKASTAPRPARVVWHVGTPQNKEN